ncbi:hypothetical protein Tco_0825479 [Tanacetum coccineum]
MVALLEKTYGSEGFHQIVDILNASHIRKYLQLADAGGLSSLPNTEIFDQLSLMGYAITSDKLTFQKGHFSPQWKFMIHTILHSEKETNIIASDDEEVLVVEDPSKQGRSMIEKVDLDAGISLVPPHVEVQGRLTSPQRHEDTTADDLTLAETLMEIKKDAKAKGKAKMDETESPRKMKQREQVQISRDAEVAQKLQEEFDAAERQRMAQWQSSTQSEGDKTIPKLTTESSKRDAEVELDHEGSKKQRTNEASGSVQEQPEEEETELPQEDLQQMMMVVPVEEVYVEALTCQIPNHRLKFTPKTQEVYWKNYHNDKEKELWVELKRLFEPDNDDTLWKLQRPSQFLLLVEEATAGED